MFTKNNCPLFWGHNKNEDGSLVLSSPVFNYKEKENVKHSGS